MPIDLEVQQVSKSVGIPDDNQFELWADAALVTKRHRSSLVIRIVDETEAQRINREYRNKDYATNVLSFPAELPDGLPEDIKQSQLGDLLICAPVVAREASEQDIAEVDHWAHLVVHGVLHLLGYDHEKPNEAEMMESLEIKILTQLGVGDPYQLVAE